MAIVLLGHPVWSDAGVLYSPVLSGGAWETALPLSNLQVAALASVARSQNVTPEDTRFEIDLGVNRQVRVCAIPKHTMSAAGQVRFTGYPSTALVAYHAGDLIDDYTVTRATAGTYVGKDGTLRSAASGVLRDDVWTDDERGTLLEAARTNLLLQSQVFGTSWTNFNSSDSADADTAPDGTTTADRLIEDATAGAAHFIFQQVTATADVTHEFTCFVKAGTRTWVQLNIREGASPGNALNAWFNLATGALGTTTQGGTASGVASRITALSNGWYRCDIRGAINNAATGIQGTIRITTGNGTTTHDGDGASYILIWGAQFEDNTSYPTSYIATTTVAVTRNADQLVRPYTPVPQAATYYVRFVERAQPNWVGAPSATPRIFEIGNTSADPRLILLKTAGGVDSYRIHHDNNVDAPVTSDADLNPAYGDEIELLATVYADGSVQLRGRKNGGAVTTGTLSAAHTLAGAWSAATIHVGSAGANGSGDIELRDVLGMPGTAITDIDAFLATAHYDSGWIDALPSATTAEDRDGINCPALALPASTVPTLRYLTVQIHDETNAAGYVDLHRLIISGGYQPEHNMSVGPSLGWIPQTTVSETDGGARFRKVKPRRRQLRFALDDISESELLANVFELQRRAGTSGQLFAVFDPDDTTHLHRRAFLGVMESLSPIQWPNVLTRGRTEFAIVEEL